MAAVTGQHVERFAAPDSEPAPLADGEVVMSVVLAEPAARAIDHLTRPILEPGVAAKELALPLAGEEAEVLALGTAGNLEAGVPGELSDLAAWSDR